MDVNAVNGSNVDGNSSVTQSPLAAEYLDGVVKFFDAGKGYGFIVSAGVDHFAHFKEIEYSGYKSLNQHQRVKFVPKKGPKGMLATRIIPLKGYDGV